MRIRNIRVRATLAAGFVVGFTLQLWGQAGAPAASEPTRNPLSGDPKAITQGAVLFRQECTFCHGVGARGGMRAPDLTTGAWSHGGSDAELARTISGGVPGTAMPPNNLTDNEIWEIIAYLRTLEQPAAATTGDRARGEALFFGAAGCATCHIVNGRGGLLGPELSTVGSARSRAYLVESIRQPGRQLTQNRVFGESVTLKYDTVTAVTADGRTIVGVPMNEDTFTVQLMDTSERIHSLDKRSLKSLQHENRSLMPAYDERRLGGADLDDLMAYLQSLRSTASAPKKGTAHERH
jgi:putative heme-binding domain-containing protein